MGSAVSRRSRKLSLRRFRRHRESYCFRSNSARHDDQRRPSALSQVSRMGIRRLRQRNRPALVVSSSPCWYSGRACVRLRHQRRNHQPRRKRMAFAAPEEATSTASAHHDNQTRTTTDVREAIGFWFGWGWVAFGWGLRDEPHPYEKASRGFLVRSGWDGWGSGNGEHQKRLSLVLCVGSFFPCFPRQGTPPIPPERQAKRSRRCFVFLALLRTPPQTPPKPHPTAP